MGEYAEMSPDIQISSNSQHAHIVRVMMEVTQQMEIQ